MEQLSIENGEAEHTDRFILQQRLIAKYKHLSDLYVAKDFHSALTIEAEIETINLQLQEDKYHEFYDTKKEGFLTYAEYVMRLDEDYHQTIFEIKESTGEGNYNDVEKWSFSKITDYLKRKQKQIEKINAKYDPRKQ